ncbi:hypothetical protein MZO42_13660 [Sphingomonas psychrotolerans]|uniref:dCTP deaminase n=1 Tax=Sphingomonas psychrotolerans TaxID=1327635 RepID=A0ABU3N797_9SPHN|nr:hypothetical protein [Sphingomonas psychrotolerans]MDT8759744.1 hypothetical protein [Sphingomonas psychrotolerans]
MLIISNNLRSLVQSTDLCDVALVEEFSIKLLLGKKIRRISPTPAGAPLVYNAQFVAADYFDEEETVSGHLILAPGDSLLACTEHRFTMPAGYFGLAQTKGTLARLFVSATCNDGQIEPGFTGRITLELTNHAKFAVQLAPGDNIAQLFLFRCSTDAVRPYQGRYAGADGPTIADFK